jgi:hypothetical protein
VDSGRWRSRAICRNRARPGAQRRAALRVALPRFGRGALPSMTAAARGSTFDELYAEIIRLPEGSRGEILEPGTLTVMGRPGQAPPPRGAGHPPRARRDGRGHRRSDGGSRSSPRCASASACSILISPVGGPDVSYAGLGARAGLRPREQPPVAPRHRVGRGRYAAPAVRPCGVAAEVVGSAVRAPQGGRWRRVPLATS